MPNRVNLTIGLTSGIKDLQIDNKKRKNSSRAGRGTSSHRTESEVDSHDSSSISTLDQAVKQWMVAAAKGDYHTLMKMLRDDPRLSKVTFIYYVSTNTDKHCSKMPTFTYFLEAGMVIFLNGDIF